jgi:glutaminase
MNKKGFNSLDTLEIVKIILLIIAGAIIINELLKRENVEEIKCACDCLDNTIKTIRLN